MFLWSYSSVLLFAFPTILEQISFKFITFPPHITQTKTYSQKSHSWSDWYCMIQQTDSPINYSLSDWYFFSLWLILIAKGQYNIMTLYYWIITLENDLVQKQLEWENLKYLLILIWNLHDKIHLHYIRLMSTFIDLLANF